MPDEWRLMSVCDYNIQKYLQNQFQSKKGIESTSVFRIIAVARLALSSLFCTVTKKRLVQ